MTLAEEIATIVHAFPDEGRKDAIRDLAQRVEILEAQSDNLAEAYLAAANRATQQDYELDLLEDAIDMLTDERDELKAHWAYCTRGCDACTEALDMLKDTP